MAAKADLKTTISADMTGFAATMRRAGGLAATTGIKIGKSLGGAGKAIGGLALSAGKVAASLTAAGAAAAGTGFVVGIKNAADLGGKLADLSARTGIAAGQLAIMGRAFEDNGVSADKIGGVINKLQKAITDFGNGSKTATKPFETLGIKFEDISKLDPAAQFELIQKKISAIQDPAQRAALAMQIFGKSGGELLTLFADGKAFANAGAFLGTQAEILNRNAGLFDEISDKLGRIPAKLQGFFVGALEPIAQNLNDILTKFESVDFAKMGQDFGAKIPEMVAGIMSFVDGAYKAFQIWQRIGELISATFLALSSPDYWSGLANIMTAALLKPLAQFQDAVKAVFSGDDIMEALSGKGEKSPLTKWLDDLGTRGADKIQPIVDVLADAFRPLDSLGDVMAKYSGAITAATSPEATTGGEDLAAKAAEYKKAGFGGLGGLYQMQADKYNGAGVGGTTFGGLNALAQMQSNRAAGLAIGTGNAFSMSNRYGVDENGVPKTGRFAGIAGVGGPGFTTGLGEKRRLRTSGDDKDAKKNLSIQEQQAESLKEIENNIKSAVTVN
jgi:hypothetical protein